MQHYHRRTLGIARVKAHAISNQQLKKLNIIVTVGFLMLTCIALISTF